MGISKRMFGVEGYETSSSTLSISKIKSLAPKKINDYLLIDSFKKSLNINFIYETKDKSKRKTIFINIEEIQKAENPYELIDSQIRDRFNCI